MENPARSYEYTIVQRPESRQRAEPYTGGGGRVVRSLAVAHRDSCAVHPPPCCKR